MGIFKDKKGDKARKRVQDRFMRRALQANFPDAKSNDMLEFEFTEAFSEDKLSVIGKVTDRLVIGRGEFDKPYQQSKLIARKYARYISGDDDPDDAMVQEMIAELTKLEGLASAWLKTAEAKWSAKGADKQDRTTQIKQIEARGMLNGARTAIFQLSNRQKLQDPATQKLVTELEAARDKLNAADATAKDHETYRAADAKLLATVCGSDAPDSGTSDVKLVKGPSGGVAYAFKSVEGESDMMGTPKGFATSREVLMSKMVGALKANYGLDFGWPQVTMAQMDGKSGALIDGVDGVKAGGNELSHADVPAEAMQKILFCNLAASQFDIKWEDVRFNRKGDKIEPTCMDGGAAMPDGNTATTFLAGLSDGKPGQTIIENGDPATGGFYPEALKPLSPELIKQFMSIKTKELKAEMDAQAKALEKEHQLKVKELGLDSGVQVAMTSIESIQKILADDDGTMTLVDFMKRYHAEVVQKKFVEPNIDAWKRHQLGEYAKLVAKHPGLFAPAANDSDAGDLYRNVLHPEVRANLKALVDLAKPQTVAKMLEAYGEKLPLTTVGVAIVRKTAKIKASIAQGLADYDKLVQKYPGVIVSKDSFPSLEEAYAGVVAHTQEYALGQLKEISEKLAKEEQQPLTIAGLLQRYGYKVPTYNFKEKLTAINDDLLKRKPAVQ